MKSSSSFPRTLSSFSVKFSGWSEVENIRQLAASLFSSWLSRETALLSAAAAFRPPLLSLLYQPAQAQLAPLCALLFALCLSCRRALKILYPPRQCRAGRSELKPGAGRKMTSRGLWPLLRKYENGKRKSRKKKSRVRYLSRERLACWGRRGKERDRARDEIERKGHFLKWISRQMYLQLRCTGAH